MEKHDISRVNSWWKRKQFIARPLAFIGLLVIPIIAPFILMIEYKDEWIGGMIECFACAFFPWVDEREERKRKWNSRKKGVDDVQSRPHP